jgi:peptidoglycan/LPS O-acetylase OafA/YrhL
MNLQSGKKTYRPDIDILRAVAVISVILFHFGYLPNGYLGVDVFFAISGYLITRILYDELIVDSFSLKQFYLRRIRRIIPLMLVVSITTLIVGLVVMLPDDLENLSQSVIATTLFSNNILLWLTSRNYWNLANDFKPLMHTWSLGVEEQFYLLFPFIFLLCTGVRKRFVLPVLTLLALVSILLFLFSANPGAKFYLTQYRFFELAMGGFAAILFKNKKLGIKFQPLWLLIIVAVLFYPFAFAPDLKLLTVVMSSVAFLCFSGTGNENHWLIGNRNRIGIFLGKISFSLYMWHQPVLAFTRYAFSWEINSYQAVLMLLLILVVSILSYYFIEQPFRNQTRVNTKRLLASTGLVAITVVAISLYIYSVNGVIRDVPELDEYRSSTEIKLYRKSEKNIDYNSRIYKMNRAFSSKEKIRILVIGDSFARDWANILLELPGADRIELSYCVSLEEISDGARRLKDASFIFFSELSRRGLDSVQMKYKMDTSKVWNVGTKSFGVHNGLFYNKRYDSNYCNLHTIIHPYFLKKNKEQKNQWGERYIDLIAMVADSNEQMPVFTPQCKFISQDGHHLTIPGAAYFAQLVAKSGMMQYLEKANCRQVTMGRNRNTDSAIVY